jgi:hypothetical protein
VFKAVHFSVSISPLTHSPKLQTFLQAAGIKPTAHQQTNIQAKTYSHTHQMSYLLPENGCMKNTSNMGRELEKQIEGLSANQIKLLASIYAGLAERLRKKNLADSLMNWKLRDD